MNTYVTVKEILNSVCVEMRMECVYSFMWMDELFEYNVSAGVFIYICMFVCVYVHVCVCEWVRKRLIDWLLCFNSI